MKLLLDIASQLEAEALTRGEGGPGVSTKLKFFRPKSECNALVLTVQTDKGQVLDQILIRVSGRDGKIRTADMMRGQVAPAIEVSQESSKT